VIAPSSAAQNGDVPKSPLPEIGQVVQARAFTIQRTERKYMNRRSSLKISVLTALGLVLLTGSAAAQQRTLQQQLVGAWTIVSYEAIAPDGTKRQFAKLEHCAVPLRRAV
jgi:hypothetical protein